MAQSFVRLSSPLPIKLIDFPGYPRHSAVVLMLYNQAENGLLEEGQSMSGNGKFSSVATAPNNPKWEQCISRKMEIYRRSDDVRTEFHRDYNRILHCTAYRRLKHKTQVFFATRNDHICTRIEHVNLVGSISYTICSFLGLNTELATAIAIGHDLGHAPFGHEGEEILKRLAKEHVKETFWHEKNSLWFVDRIETLKDPSGTEQNLNLTYAVRDGLICHCGEVNEEAIIPRDEPIDLESIEMQNEVPPYTWEACVVKMADKIAFLGRDIEDALTLGIFTNSEVEQLQRKLQKINSDILTINNTVLVHQFVVNLCQESHPDKGIRLSEKHIAVMKEIQDFSQEHIYQHPRLDCFKKYAELIISSIFETLRNAYDGRYTLERIRSYKPIYPNLTDTFSEWLVKYSDVDLQQKENLRLANQVIYHISDRRDYLRAILDYISGMTDSYAIKIFNELTSF